MRPGFPTEATGPIGLVAAAAIETHAVRRTAVAG
jgi:hypothetical protein